ncbi:MAG: SHOCT domain-containing protein [Bacteroidetes bacterium]|nr:SHOCT domain-containing protein [Bacteroidota bacterium]
MIIQQGSVSVADELKKLKDLLDAGVLTKEEYDAQKQKILSK